MLCPTVFPRIPVGILMLLALGVMTAAAAEEVAISPEQVEFFESRIRPVLAQHCVECHSADAARSGKLKAGLQLDSRAGLLTGGDSGAALVPGKPAESLLLSSLKHETYEMPPSGKLPAAIIADFEQWIAMGAPDPRGGEAAEMKTPTINWESARTFWAYQPVQPVAPPTVADDRWSRNSIDRVVLATLRAQGLSPVREATKGEWLRRVTFDLTGLPPTPEEIEQFHHDDSATAYETVVERLLASPAYGERWARHWLDVARYSEDQAHTFAVKPKAAAFRYRDWVIQAFNDDMPYDRFVRLQLAGDLEDEATGDRFTRLGGLGLLGLGAEYYKNTAKDQAIADELDDRIDTVTRGFLGLTVSCARCHDHKYDPIPTRDYYSLAGVFNGSQLTEAPLVPPEVVQAYNRGQQQVKEREERVKAYLQQIAGDLVRKQAQLTELYLVTAWKLNALKAAGANWKVADIASEQGLHPYFLSRWVDYLTIGNRNRVLPELHAVIDAPKDGVTSSIPFADIVVPAQVTTLAVSLEQQFVAALSQEKPEGALLEVRKGLRDNDKGPYFTKEDVIEKQLLTEANQPRLAELRGELEAVKKSVPEMYPVVHVLSGGGETMPIYVRGNPKTKGEVAPKGFLTILKSADPNAVAPEPSPQLSPSKDPLYASSRIGPETPGRAVEIDVEIKGARELYLIVDGAGDGISCDWADWAEPRLVAADGTETRLTDMTWSEATSEWQTVRVGTNVAGGPLKINGQPVAYGIGTHAASLIRYELPQNHPFVRFRTRAGLDDGGANQGNTASVRFQVTTQRPESVGGTASPQLAGHPQYTRADLARDIADPQNPLTARVMVNRIWQHHFGRGLVATPSNFGQLGDRPSHPELLDWLTQRFVASGWSLKDVHRQIVLSATYRLSSDVHPQGLEQDPRNVWLWRASRRRLDVEAWRDALLAVSGRLDRTLGGPTTNLADANNSRRTVYAKISRHELDGLLRLFDFPDANVTADTRTNTTVPQQQLFVLNSPFFVTQAKAFAARLQSLATTDDERITHAYQLAYGRLPSEAEQQVGLQFLQSAAEMPTEGSKLSPWEQYAQALLAANEFLYVD